MSERKEYHTNAGVSVDIKTKRRKSCLMIEENKIRWSAVQTYLAREFGGKRNARPPHKPNDGRVHSQRKQSHPLRTGADARDCSGSGSRSRRDTSLINSNVNVVMTAATLYSGSKIPRLKVFFCESSRPAHLPSAARPLKQTNKQKNQLHQRGTVATGWSSHPVETSSK